MWPPSRALIGGFDEQQADTMLANLREYYDGCKAVPFPYAGTVVQTVTLRNAVESGAIPLTRDGVLTFLSYNKQGANTRPPEVQAAFTAAFVSGPAQIEQRVTNGGQTNAVELGNYFGNLWLVERIKAGEKSCWLSSVGWSADRAVTYFSTLAAQYEQSFPPDALPPGQEPILYVPGVLAQVPTPDNPDAGGFGGATTSGAASESGGYGPPSSYVRPDDRWYYADGTIRNAQGVVVGTYDVNDGNTRVPQALIEQPPEMQGTGLVLWNDGSYRFRDGSVATNPQPPIVEQNALPAPGPGTVAASGTPMPQVPVSSPNGGPPLSQSSAPGGVAQVASDPAPTASAVPAAGGGMMATLQAPVLGGVPLWAAAGLALAAVILLAKKGGS